MFTNVRERGNEHISATMLGETLVSMASLNAQLASLHFLSGHVVFVKAVMEEKEMYGDVQLQHSRPEDVRQERDWKQESIAALRSQQEALARAGIPRPESAAPKKASIALERPEVVGSVFPLGRARLVVVFESGAGLTLDKAMDAPTNVLRATFRSKGEIRELAEVQMENLEKQVRELME